MNWFIELPSSTQTALIAAGAALTSGLLGFLGVIIAVVLRDFWAAPRLEVRREARERKRAAFSVYRSYVDPLASATTSVFWRLHEAFYDPGRASYLKFSEPFTEFQRYKKVSTVYRMAALFGWIRAFRRELAFFTLDDKTRVHAVEEAIGELEHSLAEGKLVEARRAEQLAELWNITLPKNPDLVAEAAVMMEEAIKTRHKLDDLWQVACMEDEQQLCVFSTAAAELARFAGEPEVSEKLLESQLCHAVGILSVREAWIFRDQQGAIGDVMLEEVPPGGATVRRFDVKGYAAFEAMMTEEPDRLWFGPIEKMLDSVDLRQEDGSDARVRQLRETLFAAAQILVSIASVEERPGSVSDVTVNTAKKVLRDRDQEVSQREAGG